MESLTIVALVILVIIQLILLMVIVHISDKLENMFLELKMQGVNLYYMARIMERVDDDYLEKTYPFTHIKEPDIIEESEE